jgi:GT2 family glycosyltransferase
MAKRPRLATVESARSLARELGGLPRRAGLTLRYHGTRETAWRLVTFPLRLTPLGARLGLPPVRHDRSTAKRSRAALWYRRRGRPVAVVIPSYGPPDLVLAAVRSVRRTTDRRRVRVIVVDDGSPAADRAALQGRLTDAELVVLDENRGFAAAVNAGLAKLRSDEDAVILNSDVTARPGWLPALQAGAYRGRGAAIAGPRLLYPDGTIQSAGSVRNPGAPEWFDHRYRFAPENHGPAQVPGHMLAMTGACLYLRADHRRVLGGFDEAYAMGYEDVDLCLRAWNDDREVAYVPASVLVHHESRTRGGGRSERELRSQETFWSRWGEWLDHRPVRTVDGGLRVIYVTEDTGVGGGHRVIFEHLNGLSARGHDAELWTLTGPPGWFDLRAPVRTFPTYEALAFSLARQDALKVATWWNTARHVWRASVARGIPVFLVQDIETSYYPHDRATQAAVLAAYRPEFAYVTDASWTTAQLRDLGLESVVVSPGVDLQAFRPLGLEREADVLLALGRTHPLKDFPLTLSGWERLARPRPALRLFGTEPELADRPGLEYVQRPSDDEVNRLYNTATVFLQTSRHEGFCLPLLEAMATGAPVVCTDADGNRDFCRDGENCLMVGRDPADVARAVGRLLGDPALRRRLGAAGIETARRFAWPGRIDELERVLLDVAARHETASARADRGRGAAAI